MSQSQRDKLLEEFSQTDEERWARLTGGFENEDGDSNEAPAEVERLHSKKPSKRSDTQAAVRSQRAKKSEKGVAAPADSGATKTAPGVPAAAGAQRQLTLFDKRLPQLNQHLDIDKLLMERGHTRDQDDESGALDMSKFMQDDDDDDADAAEENFSAEGFLSALLATDKAAAPLSQQQEARPDDRSSLFDGGDDEDRMVVPLSDEVVSMAAVPPRQTTAQSHQGRPSKTTASTASAVSKAGGAPNFVKKDMSTAPLQIKPEQEVAVSKTEEESVTFKTEESPEQTVVPHDAAVYWLDAKEQDHNYAVDPGSVFLFGKYSVGGGSHGPRTFESCCVRVVNMCRSVMILPRSTSSIEDAVREVAALCARLDIRNFRMKPVHRYYAFEEPNIPREKRQWIKLRFPASHRPLPTNVRWMHVEAVVGAERSLLELFIMKRRLRGPGYLKITEWVPVPQGQRVSHCRHEFHVMDPKMVAPVEGGAPPPLIALSIQLHTQLDHAQSHNEVHAVSMIVCRSMAADGSAKAAAISQQLVGVRPFHPTQSPLPVDLEKHCQSKGLPAVRRFANEQQLLQWVATSMVDIDADIIVGHNYFAFTLDVLLHRFSTLGVFNWSSLGRLDLRTFPKLQSGAGGTNDSTQHEREVCVGRLVVDTYVLAREYFKSSNYKLIALAQQLGLHGIFGPMDDTFEDKVPVIDHVTMTKSAGVFEVVARCVNNSVLSLALANQLDVIPLTKRLCSLAGNLWSRTLSGSRAERIEYLLLHAFHELKFVTPDKKSYEAVQRAKQAELEEGDAGAEGGGGAGGSRRAKAKYKGGMVLEPKSGLYTDYILMLDFNSLYPSLIQEFNICFTTVKRVGGCQVFAEGEDPRAPSGVPPPESLICSACSAAGSVSPCPHKCILPKVIKGLVDSRREVKKMMKFERDPANLAQLEIRQKALKLTANSMYGCLGFEYSRFYAQPLAELVTRQGRQALTSTVELVPLVHPSLRVLYGDTDSVMIQTGIYDDLRLVRDMANDIKAKVNKTYRCLEIDVDGIFRSILLHKKKKYAAVHVVDWAGEGKILKKEVKGLDMVRRDWCRLSQQCCDELLNRILETGEGKDDVLDFIAEYMGGVAQRVRDGNAYQLEDFIIAKSLTKEPELYKGTAFPHATVAQRLRDRKEQVRVGDLIPYVICMTGDEGTNHAPIASKAFHPEEVRREGKLLDVEWYLLSQLYPPVLRICEHIQGFTASQLGDAMGIKLTQDDGSHHDEPRDRDQQRDTEVFASMFKSQCLEECFPDAARFEIPCAKCHIMTTIQPHDKVRAVLEGGGNVPVDALPTFSVYECGACRAPQRIVYVTNHLAQCIRRHLQNFYRAGGSSAAVRQLRAQMTYFRALFDVPHMPGCPRKVIRVHETKAVCCLAITGQEQTREESLKASGEVQDPALTLVQSMYDRIDHMFLDVGHVLQQLPTHRK